MDEAEENRLEEFLDHEPLEFSFPVERGKIEEFADAIHDTNDVFRDRQTAREAGFRDIPAPLTFVEVYRFERSRLPDYEPDTYFDEKHALHGAQEYEYNRKPVAGDTLTAKRQFEQYFSKGGSSGELVFGIFKTEYFDQNDELTVTTRKTRIIVKDGESA